MIKIKFFFNVWFLLIIFFDHGNYLFFINQNLKSEKIINNSKSFHIPKNVLKDYQDNLITEYSNYGKWNISKTIPDKYLYAHQTNTITYPRSRWSNTEKKYIFDISWKNFENYKKNYGFFQYKENPGTFFWNIFEAKKLISLTPFTIYQNINTILNAKISLEIDGFITRKTSNIYDDKTWKKNFSIILENKYEKHFNLSILENGGNTNKNYYYDFEVILNLFKSNEDLLCNLTLKYVKNDNYNYSNLKKQRQLNFNIKIDLLQKFDYLPQTIKNFSLWKYGNLEESVKINFNNQTLILTKTKRIIDSKIFALETLKQNLNLNFNDLESQKLNLLEDTYNFFDLKKSNDVVYKRQTSTLIIASKEKITKFDFLLQIFYLWIQKIKWKWKYFWEKTRLNKMETSVSGTKIKHLYDPNLIIDFKEITISNEQFLNKITIFLEKITQKLQQHDWLTTPQKLKCDAWRIFDPLDIFGKIQKCREKTSFLNGRSVVEANIRLLKTKLIKIQRLISSFDFNIRIHNMKQTSLTSLLNKGVLILNLFESETFKKKLITLTKIIVTITDLNLLNETTQNSDQKIWSILNNYGFGAKNFAPLLRVISVKKFINLINLQSDNQKNIFNEKYWKKYQGQDLKKTKQKCEINLSNNLKTIINVFVVIHKFSQQKFIFKMLEKWYYAIIFNEKHLISDNFFLKKTINLENKKILEIKQEIIFFLETISLFKEIETEKLIWKNFFIKQKKWWTINDQWWSWFQGIEILWPKFQIFKKDLRQNQYPSYLFETSFITETILLNEFASILQLIII